MNEKKTSSRQTHQDKLTIRIRRSGQPLLVIAGVVTPRDARSSWSSWRRRGNR